MKTGLAISAMIDYLNGNLHEVEHLLKVYGYAKAIGELEGLDDQTQQTLEIAAVVHDIGIPLAMEKYGDDSGPYQEELGPDAARAMLEKLGCDAERIKRVCYLVGHHHTYTGVDGIDYQILLEADFLVNASHKKLAPKALLAAREGFFRTKTGSAFLNTCFNLKEDA